MKSCVIIAGGDVGEHIDIPENALVICADCGYRHAQRLGIVPDYLMGDFDSFSGELPDDCVLLRHPAEKDETDTWLAVLFGKEQGCTEFHIYGALGGWRFDHTFANLQMLHQMAEQGLSGTIHDDHTIISVQLPGTKKYPYLQGYLSVFSLTDTCTGVTMKNVKYPLRNAELCNTVPLGVSNEIIGETAEISLASGALLIIRTENAPNS